MRALYAYDVSNVREFSCARSSLLFLLFLLFLVQCIDSADRSAAVIWYFSLVRETRRLRRPPPPMNRTRWFRRMATAAFNTRVCVYIYIYIYDVTARKIKRPPITFAVFVFSFPFFLFRVIPQKSKSFSFSTNYNNVPRHARTRRIASQSRILYNVSIIGPTERKPHFLFWSFVFDTHESKSNKKYLAIIKSKTSVCLLFFFFLNSIWKGNAKFITQLFCNTIRVLIDWKCNTYKT